MNVTGKQVVVLGMGESGRAAAELLVTKGADVIIRDSKMNERIERVAERLRPQGVRVEVQPRPFHPCRIDLGVLSPGIDPSVPLVSQLRADKVPIISEIELAFRFCEKPVVAITGTNGKSTTTELIAAVLTAGGKRTEACGNIGKPFSDVARNAEDLDVITLEVSSFQLEAIETFRPRMAVFLNFAPDHLDRYRDMDEYWKAKLRIFENQGPDDFALVNSDLSLPFLAARRITFNAYGREAEYTFRDGWLCRHDKKIIEQSKTSLRGPHNAENQLAALALGDLYGIDHETVAGVFASYRALPHRCELVRQIEGVDYVNDSKATNLHSLESALQGMSTPCVLIAGGKDKGFDYAAIKDLVGRHVAHAVLIGEAQSRMVEAWGQRTRCHRAVDLADAVQTARRLARPGQTVLLSPGCSSYDMFKNFEERGQLFRELVKDLA
ncbi:MAG: UDP-N-acetylmuramoyl-L-alanine--D-glutamate ligase [Candidatus Methylacidiphilales bacterium]|nr:UDP-N-acetylmuramoyl-L-alanine--D-glutamate ligase [Candidatus Methylacidiphilales bacterium]